MTQPDPTTPTTDNPDLQSSKLADAIQEAKKSLAKIQAQRAECLTVLDTASPDARADLLGAVSVLFSSSYFGPHEIPLVHAVNALARDAGFTDWMEMFRRTGLHTMNPPKPEQAESEGYRIRRVFRSGEIGHFGPFSFNDAIVRAMHVPLQELLILDHVEITSPAGEVVAAVKPSRSISDGERELRIWNWTRGPLASLGVEWLEERARWSRETFGPGARTKGVLAHIRKELAEIEADPTDATEWADLIILALDGASRAGIGPESMIEAILAKHERNKSRTWPDWRGRSEDDPIEHVRTPDGIG